MSETGDNKLRASPYPGCRNYDLSDADWFFGRRREREMVISNLFHSRSRLTIYYGASGVGKTSLLLADVVPVLRGKKRPPEIADADRKRYDSAVVVVFRGWQDRNFQRALRDEILSCVLEKMNRVSKTGATLDEVALKKKIAAAFEDPDGNPGEPSADGKSEADIPKFLPEEAPLPEFIAACCRVAGRMFLIFDQFEEYFRYFADSPEREAFDGDFATLVNSPEIPVTILVSLREDGLSKLDRLQLRIPNLFENMLRLEHLDEQGAREAIKVPLDQFNAMRARNAPNPGDPPKPIVFTQKLIDELAHEVAPKPAAADGPGSSVSDGTPGLPARRYQGASYLQILLASAWREVEQNKETELTVEKLIRAARGYARSMQADGTVAARDDSMTFSTCAQQIAANYVFSIMEDELASAQGRMPDANRSKIEEMGLNRLRDNAARILRYLVTPGGAKMAHTVDTLALWANANMDGDESGDRELGDEEIDLTLRLLTEAGLVRRAESGSTIATIRYEVAHDVLGTPIDKWREAHERKRAAARAAKKAKADEKKQAAAAQEEEDAKRASWRIAWLTRVAIGCAALLIVAIVGWQNAKTQSRLAKLAVAQGLYLRSADYALRLLTGDTLEAARMVALTSIPAVEEEKDMLAPPQALHALRFATRNSAQDFAGKPADWLDGELTYLDSYLPSLLSPDKRHLITFEGKYFDVWDTEQLYRKERTFPAVGGLIAKMGFTEDSKTFFVIATDESVTEWSVDTWQQQRTPNKNHETKFAKKLPIDDLQGPYPAYSSITTKWTQDALPNARALLPGELGLLPAGTRMDRIPIEDIVQAFALGPELRASAKSQLIAATKKFVRINDETAQSLLARKAGMRLVHDANILAAQGDRESAVAKYEEAMKTDSALKLDPQKEADDRKNYSQFQNEIKEGNAAAAMKDIKTAVQRFQRAKELRPDLWGNLNPEEEAKRLAEPAPSDPSGPATR